MTVTYKLSNRISDAWVAYQLIESLQSLYPGFHDWFVNKALPDIVLGHGVLALAEQHSQVVGVALGRSGARPKLRCVRVVPTVAGRGIGLHLIDCALKQIGSDRPSLTVPQEHIHDFVRPFVNRYGFSLDHVSKGLYRPGKLEYVFNNGDLSELRSKTCLGAH